jgi:hypothetical protein
MEDAMGRITNELGRTALRLSEAYAKGLISLSLFTLLLALLGLFIYDGLQRVFYVLAIGSMSLGNLAWGIGSLLPEERGGLSARELARPLFIVMLITLPISLVFLLRAGS